MANYRIEKKRSQRTISLNAVDIIKKQELLIAQLCEVVHKQEEERKETLALLSKQNEYLERFYSDFQEMKAKTDEKCIRSYMEMRDSMVRDMEFFASKGWQDTPGYEYLEMYVGKYEELLEDMDVEIIECKPGEPLDKSIAKPIDVVAVPHPEWHERIATVRTSGYRWKGRVLQKSSVVVAVFK